MTLFSRALVIAATSTFLSAAAFAQTPATAPAKSTAPLAAAPAAKAPRTAASLECSKQADAKGLHGKERHKFRSECKKAAAKS